MICCTALNKKHLAFSNVMSLSVMSSDVLGRDVYGLKFFYNPVRSGNKTAERDYKNMQAAC